MRRKRGHRRRVKTNRGIAEGPSGDKEEAEGSDGSSRKQRPSDQDDVTSDSNGEADDIKFSVTQKDPLSTSIDSGSSGDDDESMASRAVKFLIESVCLFFRFSPLFRTNFDINLMEKLFSDNNTTTCIGFPFGFAFKQIVLCFFSTIVITVMDVDNISDFRLFLLNNLLLCFI